MKKSYYILILCVLSLAACSKEDELTPSEPGMNYFAVPADATDAESVLRRDFYEQHGVHLLFNDTLYHELGGYYSDGTPYYTTELLDIRYSMTNQDLTEMTYDYITDIEEQREAAAIIEEYILPHLGENLLPYSMFLVSNLQVQDWGMLLPSTLYEGERCLAINAGSMLGIPESEVQTMCNDIFYALVYSKLEYETAALEDFYTYSAEYYGLYFSDFGISDFPTMDEVAYINSLGFLGDAYSLFFMFPTTATDLSTYLQAIFYDTKENFKAMYAAYPVILEKYDALKGIIEELGFKF